MKVYSSLLLLEGNNIVIQLRDNKSKIRYPGLFSVFGGALEENETPEEALIREINEELPFLNIKEKKFEFYKRFDWKDKLGIYLNEIKGKIPNVSDLFGHPIEVIKKESKSIIDNLFILRISKDVLKTLEAKEGNCSMSFSPNVAKALIMVPLDKLMILHFIAKNNLVDYTDN